MLQFFANCSYVFVSRPIIRLCIKVDFESVSNKLKSLYRFQFISCFIKCIRNACIKNTISTKISKQVSFFGQQFLILKEFLLIMKPE